MVFDFLNNIKEINHHHIYHIYDIYNDKNYYLYITNKFQTMFFKTYSTIFSRNNTKQYNHRPQRKSIFNEIMKRVKTSNKNKEKKIACKPSRK